MILTIQFKEQISYYTYLHIVICTLLIILNIKLGHFKYNKKAFGDLYPVYTVSVVGIIVGPLWRGNIAIGSGKISSTSFS